MFYTLNTVDDERFLPGKSRGSVHFSVFLLDPLEKIHHVVDFLPKGFEVSPKFCLDFLILLHLEVQHASP